MRANDIQNDFLIKCAVMGDDGSGKSSLILRFSDDVFINDTIGGLGVHFKTRTIDADGYTCKVQIWDNEEKERKRKKN